jgi:hypothetical protein
MGRSCATRIREGRRCTGAAPPQCSLCERPYIPAGNLRRRAAKYADGARVEFKGADFVEAFPSGSYPPADSGAGQGAASGGITDKRYDDRFFDSAP